MKKYTFIMACLLLILGAVNVISPTETKASPNLLLLNKLWADTVALYLRDPLWKKQYSYDAGHYLMVPLHVAFRCKNSKWKDQFHVHFKTFMRNRDKISVSRLSKEHYLYLLSQYTILCYENNEYVHLPLNMIEFLQSEIRKLWYSPAWIWERKPFCNMKERIIWKLYSNEKVRYGYYKGIFDEELFVFALAADMKYLYKIRKSKCPGYISEILNIAFNVYKTRGEFIKGGGWLFDKGVWAQHPSYSYAGQTQKVPGMNKKIVSDIAKDSSHSHRFPLWLHSLARASSDDQERYEFYKSIKTGLEKQFLDKVVVMPSKDFDAIRLTNFMDGRNGVYRWGYVTQGKNKGYGPYELSGTFNLGWWVFLGSPEVTDLYTIQAGKFPLPSSIIKTYIGPNTTRKRHPLVTAPHNYKNGFMELIVKLASELGRQGVFPPGTSHHSEDQFRGPEKNYAR